LFLKKPLRLLRAELFEYLWKVKVLRKVKDVMVTNVVTVDAGVNLKKAVERMNNHEIGCLIVLEKGSFVGILTERDVLKRVVVKARNPDETLVGDVMSKPLVVVDPEASLEEAVKLMFERRIKKLPVIKNKDLVGLVTMTDIARIHPEMVKYIKSLAVKYDLPKRMEKVIHYYVV
jgi:CBS domain-containing protein